MNIRKLAVVGALSMSLTVGSASAFAASVQDTVGLAGEESINKLVALNVFSSGGSFRPEANLTRGELTSILNKVLTLQAPAKTPVMKDVATANGKNAQVAKVVGNGYIALNGGKFNAGWSVTYGELSKALAYGLGFKAAWSTRAIDAFYYLERKGVLPIDTDLNAFVSREDAAVIVDKFLAAKGYYNIDSGVVSAVNPDGIVINNGSEDATYKVASNAALFINGEAMDGISAFGPGTAVQAALNAKGEVAYLSGGILGLQSGNIAYSEGQVQINSALKNLDLNMFVTPLPNDAAGSFSFTTFGFYSLAGVTFNGDAYINNATDEVTMLQVYMAKVEGKPFTAKNTQLTIDFSGDALANQTFEISEEAKIVLESDLENPITLAQLKALQNDNVLSGTVETDATGLVVAITAKAEPKEAAEAAE